MVLTVRYHPTLTLPSNKHLWYYLRCLLRASTCAHIDLPDCTHQPGVSRAVSPPPTHTHHIPLPSPYPLPTTTTTTHPPSPAQQQHCNCRQFDVLLVSNLEEVRTWRWRRQSERFGDQVGVKKGCREHAVSFRISRYHSFSVWSTPQPHGVPCDR